ncbi:MAG: hypothetical protein HYZ23_09640 [Chloroflexi bacterium]|nr:hypothetical protein [Chloroflexota bacterium]
MDYWNEGDRAFAFWDEDEYFYPATVLKIEGGDVYIRFDSGEEEWTDPDSLDDYVAEMGEEVECKSAQDGMYYNVTVTDVDGDRAQVEYEDETTEWANLNRLRFYMDEE